MVLWGYERYVEETFVNFADIFMGNKQKMFLIQDGGQKDGEEDSKASCTLIDSYTNPIFNNSWSKVQGTLAPRILRTSYAEI